MNVIIIGYGRVGRELASLFQHDRYNVTIIDNNPDAFDNMSLNFEGQTLVGSGFDEDVLIEAGITDADVVCAVTNVDTINMMIVEVARSLYKVKRVLARLYQPSLESAYIELGIDYVCGTTLVAENLYHKAASLHAGSIESFGNVNLVKFAFKVDDSATDDTAHSVRVADIEKSGNVKIVAYQRHGSAVSEFPDKETKLGEDDIVLAACENNNLHKLNKYMKHLNAIDLSEQLTEQISVQIEQVDGKKLRQKLIAKGRFKSRK